MTNHKKFQVFDWAGNLKLDGDQFNTFEDAYETLSLVVDGYSTSDEDYETAMEEFYIKEVDHD